MPNPLPISVGIESAMMASLGAVLKPFPIRSNPEKISIWCHIFEKDSNNLKSAEVIYPEETKIFLLPVLSDQ